MIDDVLPAPTSQASRVFLLAMIENLNSIHGALLCMNRSIQSEGAFGTIKWNRAYTRARRR